MASSKYNVSLDQIINRNYNGNRKRNRGNLSNKNLNHTRNLPRNNGKFTNFRKGMKRDQNFRNDRHIPKKSFGGSDKSRTASQSTKPVTIPKVGLLTAKNRINKSIQAVKTGGEVRLFTKHFDARAKIQSKQQVAKSPGMLAKKALLDARNNKKTELLKHKRNLSSPHTERRLPTTERESKFTGSSIKIIAKNDTKANERKSQLKGNSLSVVAKNKPRNRNRNNKVKRSTNASNNFLSISTGSNNSYQQPYTPEPDFVSPVKKSLPAKVVISNLHHSVSQDDIQELFGAIGIVRDARLKSSGTAEVVYSTAEDAFAAFSKYHGRNLDGQPMILKITTADDIKTPTLQSGFMQARSSNRSTQSQQYYTPPLLSGSKAASTGKPVVFTVKL